MFRSGLGRRFYKLKADFSLFIASVSSAPVSVARSRNFAVSRYQDCVCWTRYLLKSAEVVRALFIASHIPWGATSFYLDCLLSCPAPRDRLFLLASVYHLHPVLRINLIESHSTSPCQYHETPSHSSVEGIV